MRSTRTALSSAVSEVPDEVVGVTAGLTRDGSRATRRRWLPVVCNWAGFVLGIVLCYGLFRQVDFALLRDALAGVEPWWVGVALLSVAATVWVRAMRWRVLLAVEQPPQSPVLLSRWVAVGQVLNSVVPARAGEVARAYLGGAAGPAAKCFALGTVGAEKLVDLVVWSGMLLLALAWFPMPLWVVRGAGVLLAVLLAALVGLAVGLWLVSRLFRNDLQRLLGEKPGLRGAVTWAQAVWNGVWVLFRPGVFGRVLAWSAALSMLYLVNNLAVFYALGICGSVRDALVVLVILQAGIVPPSTPAKVGVFEYLCVLSIGLLGFGQMTGMAYGVLLHMVVLLPPLVLVLLPIRRVAP